MLHREPGAETVEAAMEEGALSTVNWSEVYERLLHRGIDVDGVRVDVEALGLEIVPFTADDAERAAQLAPPTRGIGLSLGDRACLALADRLSLPALTADRSWLGLDLGVAIQPIR